MMSQSWMGTDFTNDDLVKAGIFSCQITTTNYKRKETGFWIKTVTKLK